MLTLFHATQARSFSLITLLYELDAMDDVQVEFVDIMRPDGSGQIDARNPHPEGKVPALLHDDQLLTESLAIATHLCTLYPERVSPQIATPKWGAFLTWMFWIQAVLEPVAVLKMTEISHPVLERNYRDIEAVYARINGALADGGYLMGDKFSAADIFGAALFNFAPQLIAENTPMVDWVARINGRNSVQKAFEFETKAHEKAKA